MLITNAMSLWVLLNQLREKTKLLSKHKYLLGYGKHLPGGAVTQFCQSGEVHNAHCPLQLILHMCNSTSNQRMH